MARDKLNTQKSLIWQLLMTILILYIGMNKVMAQHEEAQVAKREFYFIEVENVPQGKRYEVKDSVLRLVINENYTYKGSAQFNVLDWKRDTLATMEAEKIFGVNQYSFRLDSLYTGWLAGEFYTLGYITGDKRKHEFLFEVSRHIKDPFPQPDIQMLPVFINCEEKEKDVNFIEFNGEIKGGVAPYEITWLVSSDPLGKYLLYEPFNVKVETGQRPPTISVTKPVGYYVTLKIKDACRQEKQQVAKIDCHIKQSNKIFNIEFLNLDNKITAQP